MEERILLIEDDAQIAEAIADRVDMLGYKLDVATDGETGLARALSGEYALILLDLNLPRLGGLEVCKRVKNVMPTLPIIMLTARDSELDRVLGLELGADDYVGKPFSVAELTARIKARLRVRDLPHEAGDAAPTEQDTILRFAQLEINTSKRQVRLSNRDIPLTPLEYEVLILLAQNPGRAFSRENLLELVWGTFAGSDTNPTPLVTRLRKKLGDSAAEPRFIKTVWGFGYRFAERSELEQETPTGE